MFLLFTMLREIEKLTKTDEALVSSDIQFNIGIGIIMHNRTPRRCINRRGFKDKIKAIVFANVLRYTCVLLMNVLYFN